MNEKLLEALGELFIEDSPLYADAKGLMELAIQEERERCAKIADAFGAQAGNDSSGGMAHVIAQGIRRP
jgi:hypothetical protein